MNLILKSEAHALGCTASGLLVVNINKINFFLSAQAGGIQQILHADWVR